MELFSQAELELTASELGIEPSQNYLAGRIFIELNARRQIEQVRAAIQAHDQAALREALTSCIGITGTIALDRLIAEAGMNVKHPESNIEKWEALYEYYTKGSTDPEVKFEVGKTYRVSRSYVDLTRMPLFVTVINRTGKSLTVKDNQEGKTWTARIMSLAEWDELDGGCDDEMTSEEIAECEKVECMALPNEILNGYPHLEPIPFYADDEATAEEKYYSHYVPTVKVGHYTDIAVYENQLGGEVMPLSFQHIDGNDYESWKVWKRRKMSISEVLRMY